MALADVRPFIRARMNALGYQEHLNAFSTEDIASTVLDGTYHIESLPTTGGPANPRTVALRYPVRISIFKRGYSDPAQALDDLDVIADTVIADFLAPSVRLGVDIKDIELGLVERLPLDPDGNDNSMELQLNFDFKLVECFD